MKDVARINSGLNSLQLWQMFSPVSALRFDLTQPWVWVVDVLAPIRLIHTRGDVADEVLQEAEAGVIDDMVNK